VFEQLPVRADGDVGDVLRRRLGLGATSLDMLSLVNGAAVQGVHRDFLAAGAQMLRTNTLAATRLHLTPLELADRTEAVNVAACGLAREVAGPEGVVMGTVGQVPGQHPLAELEKAYAEQIIYLSDSQVDFLLFSHFTSLAQAQVALRMAVRASDAPVMALLTLDEAGCTQEGTPLAQAAQALAQGGAQALGISCRAGAQPLAPLLAPLLELGLPLGVLLGAQGFGPAPLNPSHQTHFAQTLRQLGEMGVAIVGGCCGIGPEDIGGRGAV